jgi:hypothetical protein
MVALEHVSSRNPVVYARTLLTARNPADPIPAALLIVRQRADDEPEVAVAIDFVDGNLKAARAHLRDMGRTYNPANN